MNGIWSEFAEEGLKEMLYADKIMKTERYKELKDTGNTDIPFYNKSITPKENTAIIFDDKDHKHYFPDYGVRVVCIFTFS